MTRKFASLFAAVAIAVASIGAAQAAPVYKTSSVSVSYADLDLTTEAGVRTMSLRINRAISKVCGSRHDSAVLAIRRQIVACRTESLERAIAAIDAPLLTAFYQGNEGTRFASL